MPKGARRAAATLRSAHKKAGSRMSGAVLTPQLHEIGLKCRHRQVERAGTLVDVTFGLCGNALALAAVPDPGADPRRQFIGVNHEFRRAGAIKLFVNFAEIGYMGTVQDCGAKLDCLYRILAAMASQRAAHEHDGSKPIDQPQFAKCIE